MAKTQTKTTITPPTHPTRGDVSEMIDGALRKAMSEQARSLEKHLKDINDRLVTLERTR